jgi:septal ring factor EnvC (AmiA/AmiB activator)
VNGAKRSGIDLRIVAIAAIVLLLAGGGAAAWAYTTNTDLEQARRTLATTTSDLDSTKTSLAATQSKVTDASANVASEEKAIESDKDRGKVLEFQISRKAACIKAQAANLSEIRRILAMQRESYDRTTSASAWNKANSARYKAFDLAISYMAKAYTSAAAGSYATANSWLSKSNAQVRISNRQVDVGNKEVAEINATIEAIRQANVAFAETLDKSISTCGG